MTEGDMLLNSRYMLTCKFTALLWEGRGGEEGGRGGKRRGGNRGGKEGRREKRGERRERIEVVGTVATNIQ